MTVHTIDPIYNSESRILILGSFPSVKSREIGFFYGHPQNRFWCVLAELFSEEKPETVDDKKAFLLRHRIALWDVIGSCEIKGSSDISIKNVIPNDISPILDASDIKVVFVNGRAAEKLYNKHIFSKTNRPAILLPSTSPANAAWTKNMLLREWALILDYIK
jgi:hypoxanthine-DNA glycosylase